MCSLLTAIISHFGRQLLGNNMSFTPCSMHILLISNKCNKFWMSCGCRRLYTENHEKWAKTQAGRPGTSTKCAPSSVQERRYMFTKSLNRGLQVGLMKWTERPSTWIKGPTCSTYPDLLGRSTTMDFMHPLINMSVKRRAEMCQLQAGRPRGGRPAYNFYRSSQATSTVI